MSGGENLGGGEIPLKDLKKKKKDIVNNNNKKIHKSFFKRLKNIFEEKKVINMT